MTEQAACVETWQRLLTPECDDLRAEAALIDPHDAARVERLRRSWSADLVHVALELAAARRKGAAKFPEKSDLVADSAGVEQATSALVARHKAQRYADAGVARAVDLCCGIGGDAMALAEVCEVLGVDSNPVRAFMCARNAGCGTRGEDVESFAFEGAFHMDPARRVEGSGGRRVFRLEDHRPGRLFIERLIGSGRAGAVKLGPGLDVGSLSGLEEVEVELISEHGRLVQAVVWTGSLATACAQRRATLLPGGQSLVGVPCEVESVADGFDVAYLCEPAAAAERAGLLGEVARLLAGREVFPGLGLLGCGVPVESSWATVFEVIERMPFRPRRLAKWLRESGAGVIEVKTRGKAVEPNALQSQLSGDGDEAFTVFVLRLGRQREAFITRRCGGG